MDINGIVFTSNRLSPTILIFLICSSSFGILNKKIFFEINLLFSILYAIRELSFANPANRYFPLLVFRILRLSASTPSKTSKNIF